jgi:hypothetical protein
MTIRRLWLLAVVTAMVLVVGGCRLTADQDPRPIPSEQVPSDLVDPTTTTQPPRPATTAQARPGRGRGGMCRTGFVWLAVA